MKINNNSNSYNSSFGSNDNVNNDKNDQHQLAHKTTLYVGNLKDHITKQEILDELAKINTMWETLTIRLNLRTGWSHGFIDFDDGADAKLLISFWDNKTNSRLTNSRLRCEISKKQMP